MPKKILILGDIFLDIFEETKAFKISPERPVPVLKPIGKQLLLGGASNVAANIKSIGGDPFLISKLSKDKYSLELFEIIFPQLKNFKIFSNLNSFAKTKLEEEDFIFLLSIIINFPAT